MAISEKKMSVVIDNYFKSECDVNTSIRQAFEKGFRIGVQKGITLQPERKKGKWIDMGDFEQCSVCGGTHLKEFQSYYGKTKWIKTDYCPNCGADMRGISEDPEDTCSGCDYYDLEDNNCRVFECFGIDCPMLPCEEGEDDQ